MKNFRDKVVVITGAGSGMGRDLAVKLGREGAKLAISDMNPTGLEVTEVNVTVHDIHFADCSSFIATSMLMSHIS